MQILRSTSINSTRKDYFLRSLVFITLILLPFFLTFGDLPKDFNWSTGCYFKHFAGVPCPACGLTRGFIAIAHGRYSEAFGLNPMGPVLYLAFFLGSVHSICALFFGVCWSCGNVKYQDISKFFIISLFVLWAVRITLNLV